MSSIIDLLQLFPNAVLSGCIIAVTCAVFGVFVILKRVVFISMALSETAACGIAAAMLMHVHPFVGAFVLTACAVIILSIDYEHSRIPRDAVLGLVFVLASSLSILLVAKSGFGLNEVKALLYGDLILAEPHDRNLLLITLLPCLLYLLLFLRPTLYSFLDRDAAFVMGLRTRFWEMAFFLALGIVVSSASKTGGALLVFCYLAVIPAAALILSKRLIVVLILAPALALLSTITGLTVSFQRDLPGNQTITVVASTVFVLAAAIRWCCHCVWRKQRTKPTTNALKS